MSNLIISTLGTIAITTGYGLAVLGFMNLVFKHIDQKKQEQERQEKEQELAEAFKKD